MYMLILNIKLPSPAPPTYPPLPPPAPPSNLFEMTQKKVVKTPGHLFRIVSPKLSGILKDKNSLLGCQPPRPPII